MQLALRPYVTMAGAAVLCVGLIQVTPMGTAHIEQRAVHLTAVEALSDLVGPFEAALSTLTGADGLALASVTDALTLGGGALSAESGDALASLAGLDIPPLLDPGFWAALWNTLLDDPVNGFWMLLTQLPVIGPAVLLFDIFVVLPLVSLWGSIWGSIPEALDLEPFAAAEGLGTGLQGVLDATIAGVIDPALPAGVSTVLGDVTTVFGDVTGVLDPTTLIQDVSTALDPSAVTSILDLNPIADIGAVIDPAAIADVGTVIDPAAIADIGAVIDPAAIADIGTVIDPAAIADIGAVLSTSTIPDLGEILTSLIP